MSRTRLRLHGVLFILNLCFLLGWILYGFDSFWNLLNLIYVLEFPHFIKSVCLKGIQAKERSRDTV